MTGVTVTAVMKNDDRNNAHDDNHLSGNTNNHDNDTGVCKINGVFVVTRCWKTNGTTTINNSNNTVYFANTGNNNDDDNNAKSDTNNNDSTND